MSLHLPIRDEPPTLVRRTLDALSRLDYPDFEVLVIDSNTEDPALWEPVAEHCARLGPRFRFFHLGPWPGGKAGALNFGLGETAPDAVVIGVLACGTTVRPDWLRRLVPTFAGPDIGFAWSPPGMIASPWPADAPAPVHPDVLQPGSLVLLRRSAIEAAGGWAEWSLAEDVELGLRLLRDGWHGACASESLGDACQPVGFPDCARERLHHAYGVMQASRAHLGPLLSPFHPALTMRQRGNLLAACLPDLSDALSLVFLVAALTWSAGLVLYRLRFAPPLLTLVPILLLAMTAVRGVHGEPGAGWRGAARAALAGLALSIAAGSGVWQAWLGGRPPAEPLPACSRSIRRLEAVCRETALLLLIGAAIIAIITCRGLAQPGAWAWCGMLLAQSVPCATAVWAALAAEPAASAEPISRLPRGALPR